MTMTMTIVMISIQLLPCSITFPTVLLLLAGIEWELERQVIMQEIMARSERGTTRGGWRKEEELPCPQSKNPTRHNIRNGINNNKKHNDTADTATDTDIDDGIHGNRNEKVLQDERRNNFLTMCLHLVTHKLLEIRPVGKKRKSWVYRKGGGRGIYYKFIIDNDFIT